MHNISVRGIRREGDDQCESVRNTTRLRTTRDASKTDSLSVEMVLTCPARIREVRPRVLKASQTRGTLESVSFASSNLTRASLSSRQRISETQEGSSLSRIQIECILSRPNRGRVLVREGEARL